MKSLLLVLFLTFILILVVLGFYYSNTKKSRGTRSVENQYKNKPKALASINRTEAQFKFKVVDYYVASSYNSCCNGDFFK